MSRLAPLALVLLLAPAPAAAQPAAPGAPAAPLTFEEAVRRAATANPSVESATAAILRSEALLRQARAVVLPDVSARATTTTLDGARGLGDQEFTPRNSLSAAVSVSMPIFAPAQWARRAQAEQDVTVARAGAGDVRRQVALAAADAYLTVIAARRVVEEQVRSRDTARAFYEYAQQRFEGGVGSKLNALRAQQVLSSDEARVEVAGLALRRAQEALGVLVALDGPADASEDPAFAVPDRDAVFREAAASIDRRADLLLFGERVQAARQVLDDSWKEWLPSVNGIFEPQYQNPASLVQPSRSWRALVQFSVPIFDSGERRGRSIERQALLQQTEAVLEAGRREALSEVRIAWEAVERSERALAAARDAARQAHEVLEITNVSFRTGATTNIEVIDAQRRALDADTATAVAEDAVRRSRLDLLAALGQFPSL